MNVTTITSPKRTRGRPSDDGDFVVFEKVCVFDEHTGDDGVHYDARLLQAIADNCNRRIRNTGDYCPLVVAHTRDQADKKSVTDDPPVIGLAGPFYVGDWVNGDGKQVKAIFATFWIFPEEEKTFLRNPRRSVEIWPEERPEQRYFDPIALLGAETPKRDLGLVYSKSRSGPHANLSYSLPGPLRYSKRSTGRPPLKYEGGGGGGAAPTSTPGGNNTFIPGPVSTKKRKYANESGEPHMAFSPEDLQQIIEALKPTIQSLIDNATANVDTEPAMPLTQPDAGMDSGGMPGDALPGDLPAAGAGAPAVPPPPPVGGAGATPPPGGDMPPPDADQDMGGAGKEPDTDDAGGPSDDDEDDVPHPDKMKDDERLYSRGLGRKLMKYIKDGDDKGADDFIGGLDKDDKKKLTSYMKYSCDDAESKEKYAAKCGCKGMESGEMKAGEPDRYGKSGGKKGTTLSTETNDSIKYAKLREEKEQLAKKYAKLQVVADELKATNNEQQQELDKLRRSEQCATRYSKLKDLESSGYVLDPDDEMVLTSDYSDEQFRRHCEEIVPTRYSKTSANFPSVGQNRETSMVRLGMDAKAQQYCNQARDLVLKYQKSGKKTDYKTVLEQLVKNEGKLDESKLFATNGNGKAH